MVNVYIDEKELKNANLDLSTADGQESDSPDGMSSRNDRRRNSDSSLYCKQRDDETGDNAKESEAMPVKQAKRLDPDKAAFVQSYLDSVHDAQSTTTDVSDSAFGTGAESEIGSEETGADSRYKLLLKDLGNNVISRLRRVIENDQDIKKTVYQAFGLKSSSNERDSRMNIFELFPDTPVKLVKEVFEALQLYDLVELLEKEKPRSLRSALPLEEIKKLRRIYNDRPTLFHSQVAVLIIQKADENDSVRKLDSFFKDLNSDSKTDVVSLTSLQNALKMTKELKERERFQALWNRQWKNLEASKKAFEERIKKRDLEAKENLPDEDELESDMFLEELEYGSLRFRRRADESEEKGADEVKLREEIEEKEKLIEDELKNVEEAISTIMNGWIHNQDQFTLFVVMECSDLYKFSGTSEMVENCLAEKLALLPGKTKCVFGTAKWDRFEQVPELLHVRYKCLGGHFVVLMDEIINKRWQTLDLISMIKEIERNLVWKNPSRVPGEFHFVVHEWLKIKDKLSSVPKFHKKQGNDSSP